MKNTSEINFSHSFSKSYITIEGARKAVSKLETKFDTKIRHFIHHNTDSNRFAPVLVGVSAMDFLHSGFQIVA